jgi:hypothetical protein
MIKSLKNFSLLLDVVFGYYSYDNLRKLFSLNITNENYMIPDERTILLELKRILSKGLSTRILQMNLKIISSPKVLLEKFTVSDKNDLRFNPVFLAIYNTITKFKNIEIEDLNDLHNISKQICDVNIDNIFNKDRNKIQSLIEIGKILVEGFKLVNNTQEVYYGSSTLEDSYTLNGIGAILKKNLSTLELDQIIQGTYVEKQSYASM